jgi:hypothetical protein
MAFSSEVEAGSRKGTRQTRFGNGLSNSAINMVEVG